MIKSLRTAIERYRCVWNKSAIGCTYPELHHFHLCEDLTGRLRELGFRETEYVYEPGQFARRGSIVDVYSYSCELPYRIDFFDDEVDSIRSFNVETQLSEEKLEKINILPQFSAQTGNKGISLLEFVDDSTLLFCQIFKYIFQPFRLIRRIRQYKDTITVTDKITETL